MDEKLRYIVLLFLTVVFNKSVHGQGFMKDKGEKSEYSPSVGIRGAVLGSILHPGFKIGIEKPYKFTQTNIHKSWKTKTVYDERYVSYSLGMYHHTQYHSNFFSQLEWVKRRQKNTGFYLEASLGLGVSRTFVDGITYEVSEDGSVEELLFSGNWYALASLGGAVGYNANLAAQQSYSMYLKANGLLIFPYNGFITPRPTVELGVNFHLLTTGTLAKRIIKK